MKHIYLFLSLLLANCLSVFSQNYNDSLTSKLYIEKDLDTVYSEIINTGARLRLPLYFTPFSQGEYHGYMHTGTATTIIGQKMDSTAFISVTANLNKDVFLKQGAELIEELDLETLEGRPAKMYLIKFMADKTPVHRLMLFTGDLNSSLMLTANYPEIFSTLLKDVILTSFLTVQY
ncbi:MAG: hypothetical protein A2W93_08810 [Bacteroidetes bacterium GWF2_43_63]|nr:MAG: hypothetical protein A2W94_02985 [Bacteroidetes bacterium GWE2_42_42]OFY55229.1 MAG: hypothetical protein A2W93_08810 [Bacteroidetes bacterium GWF2_43_63]HBG70892.1 hypothetical protein [Bacteroidales bacterium]HCB63344.1 hypothetical protein [Bacteroidales bacterium]HCY23047.1 hypothetical protein [Bacteroidales bacterium]